MADLQRMVVAMEVGDRLRAARERRHMTQGELAAKLGVNIATVTLWENRKNRRQVGTKYLRKIAEALDIRVSELLGENEPPPPQTGLVTIDLAETQLLRLFRLMPQELKLVQLAQFFECANSGNFGRTLSQNHRQDTVLAGGAESGDSR